MHTYPLSRLSLVTFITRETRGSLQTNSEINACLAKYRMINMYVCMDSIVSRDLTCGPSSPSCPAAPPGPTKPYDKQQR